MSEMDKPEYVIQQRIECKHPRERWDFDYSPSRCELCGKRVDTVGYRYKDVLLIDVLKKMRWWGSRHPSTDSHWEFGEDVKIED